MCAIFNYKIRLLYTGGKIYFNPQYAPNDFNAAYSVTGITPRFGRGTAGSNPGDRTESSVWYPVDYYIPMKPVD